jgi:starch-binding outer membrane protein SusE/F
MKLRLLFSFLMSCLFFTAFSQSPVGIIGSATPTGWDADTDMVQNLDSAHLFSIEIVLIAGECKFRQDDAWTINWGAPSFPIGVGLSNGPNIPIPQEGLYTVTFNALTGAYSFSVASDIGIIGSATPGGWGSDTNLFPDPTDSTHYSATLNLLAGECKFRANDEWAINWGATDFPAGVGIQDGMNIPIAIAGKYLIDFNKATGAYSFEEIVEFQTIGLIGSATPGGWAADTTMNRNNANPDLWTLNITLTDGEVKFRANDAWTYSWGDSTFPSGLAIINGPNIPVTAGEYKITFNLATLEYVFLPIIPFTTVGVIGNATPGGWDADTDLTQDPLDKSIWRGRMILTDGEAKFRAENDWAVNWGAGDFPIGIATQDGANIPVPAGEYKIVFNSTTGDYSFEELVVFSTVGLIGPATPLASWDADVDMTKDAADEFFWTIPSIDLTDGEAKFRAEDLWAVNWGLAAWPSGIGKQDGPNIPITAGTYKVTLNTATGDYSFLAPGSSTQNVLKNNIIALSPNPAKDVLNIAISEESLRGEVRVTIYNNLGMQVQSQMMFIGENANINVADLTAGNYLVQLSNSKYTVGKSVVIVK